jgi:hypothetical protein
MDFKKEINKNFFFNMRVFTKSKSIISNPFLKHFHYNNSIYKITTPLLWSEGGNLQTDAAQLFLFDPIPAKAKKLGLLSNYKFSLVQRENVARHPSADFLLHYVGGGGDFVDTAF